MTREEAIEILSDEELLRLIKEFHGAKEALDLALTALRFPTREMVEKVWRGKWESTGAISCKCSKCNRLELKSRANEYNFCPYCMSPMTDEAVEMAMERLEALNEMRKMRTGNQCPACKRI